MNRRPSTHDDPLVGAYLADLERALAAADPRDRADILQGVREHVDAALAEGRPVGRVLEELGPVERVAAAAGTSAPDDRDGARPDGGRWRWSVVLLAGALGAWPFVLVLPLVTLAMTGAVLAVALHRLWRHGRQDLALHAAVVIAALGLTFGAMMLTLLESSSSVEPGPVETHPGTPVD